MINPYNNKRKKVIVIGAGVSGLTAGIYLLDNGYDVEIYEKHTIPGGECTGWFRDGTYIDGCAHWIVGTNPSSDLFPLWEHIGAFDASTPIYQTTYITRFRLRDGRIFTFWAEKDRLRKEMYEFFPKDKHNIRRFLHFVRLYEHVRIPVDKPLDQMNLFQLTAFGIHMLPMAIPYAHYKHVSIRRYNRRFHDKELGEILTRFLYEEHNIHSFFYVGQALSQNDCGMPEGGSLNMMKRVARNFTDKGGILHTGKPVKEVLIENDTAKGVELEDGTKIEADFVVAATDANHALSKLLAGKYPDRMFEEQFSDPATNPIHTSVMVALRTRHNMDDFPKMFDFLADGYKVFGCPNNHIAIRNFAFDKTLINRPGQTLLTVLLNADEKTYDYLKSLDKETYRQKKEEVGNEIKDLIVRNTDIQPDEIELLDVVTPLTYERYCNAYKGSYMAFDTTEKTKGLMRPGLIKGLHNFVLAGQWIMPPGGLPIALLSGKHAAMRVCTMDKKKFVNKENPRRKKDRKNDFRLANSKAATA